MITGKRPELEPDRLYTQGETALILGVSRQTVHRWGDLGVIRHAVRPGRQGVLYAAKDILACWEDLR